jgi:hypothetical protein
MTLKFTLEAELQPILCMHSENWPENGTKRCNLVEKPHLKGNRVTEFIGDVESDIGSRMTADFARAHEKTA